MFLLPISRALIVSGLTFFVLHSLAATVTLKPVNKEARLKALRKVLSGESQASENSSASRPKVKIENYKNKAYQELTVPKPAYSETVVPTSSTVSTKELEPQNPVHYDGLQLAVQLQNYAPSGVVPMVGLPSNNLHLLSSVTMWGLGLRYLPWTLSGFGDPRLGLHLGASYAQNKINLYGPTGVSLGDTRLHSLFSQVSVVSEWVWPSQPAFSFTAEGGVARLDLIQASQNSLASQSDSRWISVAEFGPQWRINNWWLSAHYQYRTPLTSSLWAQMDSSALVLGIVYGLR